MVEAGSLIYLSIVFANQMCDLNINRMHVTGVIIFFDVMLLSSLYS